MSNACRYTPKKGVDTFYKLKKEFGYKEAWRIYGISMNPNFKKDYKDSLSLDAEGVPSFESLVHNDYIIRTTGGAIATFLGKNFPEREDTIDNYNLALEDALTFNREDSNNKYYTAIVEYNNEGKLVVKLKPKNTVNDKIFANQYATNLLNNRLVNILSSLNLTVGLLQEIEQNAGRVGVTDFSVAKRLATDSISMIRIANNMEGAQALSEEFAHLIIGALRSNPLIQRNIAQLANEESLRSVLGEDYQDVYDFYDGDLDLIAEEALGHILQEQLIKSIENPTGIQERLAKQVQNKFKRVSESKIVDAIHEAESSMSSIASDILSGNLKLTKEDIINSERNVQFNALSNQIDRNMQILKDAIATESKRLRISRGNDSSVEYTSSIINALEFNLNEKRSKLGVLTYAKEALMSLRNASSNLSSINKLTPTDKFKLLRGIKTTLQSYNKFIDSLNDLAINEDTEGLLENLIVTDHKGDKEEINLKGILRDLNSQYKEVERQWLQLAVPTFAEFLKPILGEEITVEMGANAGKKISIEELLESSESDISFLDRWLDSLGNSSDILLRAFDKIYKNAVDEARLRSIKEFRKIQALQQEAESYGITSYEWMFEKYDDGTLTGNYISEINDSQYSRDLKEFEEYLNNKYGKNPSGEEAKKKIAERTEWYNTHSELTEFGERLPKTSLYRNKDFDKLTDKQKLIREKFLDLKREKDEQYPPGRVSEFKAIQLRKNGVQRFIDSSKSPSSILSNIKEHLKEEFLEQSDDDALFGSRSGLTDFSGKEFMTLPVLYTNRLENPNELSTDIFGSLMAYTAASNNFNALDKIIDGLETGRILVSENRKVKTTRGGMHVFEKFGALGRTFKNTTIETNGSNIVDRLNDFFESQIYHRYLKDAGVFNVFGNKVNKNKLVSAIMRGSSMAQLGFNYLTNLANVTTGVAMQNIEAAAGEYFNAKELAKADAIYFKLIPKTIAEFNSRTKTNKLSLFNELFNIREDFDNVAQNSMRKSVLARLFGQEIAYLGQTGGDHWLYMRTAIAMALREKVIVPNKGEMSLWDALQIEDSEGNTKILALPEGTTTTDGKAFDIGKFGRKIAHVNQSLFGIYNTDDRNAAQRVILGRLILQYRNWMKPQFNRRFQKGQLNLDTGKWEEGYWRTTGRILLGLARGQYQLGAQWDNLKPEEKANIRRALTELIQLTVVVLLAEFVEWPDDKDRPWAIKLAEYMVRREEHELGALTPTPLMLQELLKTVKSPAASITQAQNLTNLFSSLMDPRDWVDEIESGKYEGMSTLQKNFLKSGLPIVSQFNQFNRLIYDLDNALNYYARPY